jgi:hypothetical protein
MKAGGGHGQRHRRGGNGNGVERIVGIDQQVGHAPARSRREGGMPALTPGLVDVDTLTVTVCI